MKKEKKARLVERQKEKFKDKIESKEIDRKTERQKSFNILEF